MNKITINTYIILLLSLGISLPTASAEPQRIQLGNISYSGTGCPTGSLSASLNPESGRLDIRFNQYVVETHDHNKSSSKKICNIVIPLNIPADTSISLVSANYSGLVSLPAGTQTRIMSVYSFSGQRGLRFKSDFHGPNNSDYTLQDPLSSLASVWSACGKNTTLRITTSTRIKSKGIETTTQAHSSQGMTTQLRYRGC